MFEFWEVSVEVESSNEFEHAGGHEKHEAGDHVKTKGVGGVRVHHNRNAMIKEGDGKKNTDSPAQPWVNVAVCIEQSAKKEGREAVGDGRESLGDCVSAVKSAANRLGQGSIDHNNEKSCETLPGLEDDGFTLRKFSDMQGFAVPFAPMHQAITFSEGGEQHDWEEVGDEDVNDTASGIGNAFPGSGGGKD